MLKEIDLYFFMNCIMSTSIKLTFSQVFNDGPMKRHIIRAILGNNLDQAEQ